MSRYFGMVQGIDLRTFLKQKNWPGLSFQIQQEIYREAEVIIPKLIIIDYDDLIRKPWMTFDYDDFDKKTQEDIYRKMCS